MMLVLAIATYSAWSITIWPKCYYKSQVYFHNDEIPTEEPCENCYCQDGSVLCDPETCPPPPTREGVTCVKKMFDGICCSVYKCTKNQPSNETDSSVNATDCSVRGTRYKEGEIITSEDSVSIECRCASSGIVQCVPRRLTDSNDVKRTHA
ncbi:Uncharacterised protein g7458 [Pycnogonum litorale]